MRVFLVRTGAVVIVLALAWSTPALAQRRRGGPRPRTVVVAPLGVGAWGPGWWGPSPYWGSPFWWGGWGPGPLGVWPYLDPVYLRSQAMSSVRVQVQPRETEVFVDGYLAGIADEFDGVFQRLRLAPGPHVLELYLPGHELVRQDLMLAPGEGYKVQFTMQPLGAGEPEPSRPQPMAPPSQPPYPGPPGAPALPPVSPSAVAPVPSTSQAFGQLIVRVQPADAEILIDGEPWQGSGDRLTVNLATGRHRVEVRKDGFTPFMTTVDVVPGQPATLNVSLLRDDDQAGREVSR